MDVKRKKRENTRGFPLYAAPILSDRLIHGDPTEVCAPRWEGDDYREMTAQEQQAAETYQVRAHRRQNTRGVRAHVRRIRIPTAEWKNRRLACGCFGRCPWGS
jgi:hypothetical protein